MKVHRPSLMLGAVAALCAVVGTLAFASPGRAFDWPWERKTLPEKTVTVRGSVSCSSVTSLQDGYGGSPSSLALDYNGRTETLHFPFRLQRSRSAVFRPPHFAAYEATVTIPRDADSAHLTWRLQCVDQTGAKGSRTEGEFSVGREDLSRTICSDSTLLNPCMGPEMRDAAQECAFGVFTAGTGARTLELATAIHDGMEDWSLRDYFTAGGLTHKALGLVVGCFPLVRQHAQPKPAGTAPAAAATLPPLAAPPVPTRDTVPDAAPPAATRAPAPEAPAQTAPPPAETSLTVHNLVTRGAGMAEDPVPAYLTTYPETSCSRKGCNIGGTERRTGDTYRPAVCQAQGPTVTNGNNGDAADDGNPALFTSTRYYGVRWDGRIGYLSEVWVAPAQRGGLGLPSC